MAIEFHRDGPWELPDGWVWARLGDVTSILPGQSPPSKSYNAKGLGLPFYQGKTEFGEYNPRVRKWCPVPKVIAEAGDTLISVRAPVGPTNIADQHCGIGRGLAAIRPTRCLDQRYLLFAMRRIEPSVAGKGTGTTFGGISTRILTDELIPVPPLAEQERIVARIDELLTDIGDGETALTRARDDLDTWRRALLKAAVTGELTREWRENNKPNEPALDVLSELRGSRITLSCGRRSNGTGSTLPDQLPDLPDGWAWTTLGELAASVRNGTSIAPRADRNENEILRISAVRPMAIDLTQVRYLSDEQATAASLSTVESGDLLVTRYNGSADLVGVGAIYHDKARYYPDKLIRVRLWPQLREYSSYIEVAVNTWLSRKHIAANIKTTAGQQGLSGESLKSTPIPLPPRAEVMTIMATISAVEDDVEAELAYAGRSARALRQSVLKAAFEGRLVEQNPRDEPAEILLTRLSESSRPIKPKSRRRAGAEA